MHVHPSAVLRQWLPDDATLSPTGGVSMTNIIWPATGSDITTVLSMSTDYINATVTSLPLDYHNESLTFGVHINETRENKTLPTTSFAHNHLAMTKSPFWGTNSITESDISDQEPSATLAMVLISCLFCLIGLTGIFGNTIIIYVILVKTAMRRTVTNLFILNLSIADALIMLFGIPDVVMFMMSRGWLLGDGVCKAQRYILLVALYVSVMTLMAVCIERYIAIVHPFRAHMWCSKRRAVITLCLIWTSALIVGIPPLLFNDVSRPVNNSSVQYCLLNFPGDHQRTFMFYKYLEFFMFYLTPFLLQAIFYTVISRKLFANTRTLYPRRTFRNIKGRDQIRINEAIQARRNVVKMLIICVFVYFLSYSPSEVVLLYNTIAVTPYQPTWTFLVFVMTMAYINSAANPILYCVFSQKFRKEFSKMICRKSTSDTQSRTSSIHTLGTTKMAYKMSLVGHRLQSYSTRNTHERRHTVM